MSAPPRPGPQAGVGRILLHLAERPDAAGPSSSPVGTGQHPVQADADAAHHERAGDRSLAVSVPVRLQLVAGGGVRPATGVRECTGTGPGDGLNDITGSLLVSPRGETISSAMNAFNAGLTTSFGCDDHTRAGPPRRLLGNAKFMLRPVSSTSTPCCWISNAAAPFSPATPWFSPTATRPHRCPNARDGSIRSGSQCPLC